MTNNVFENEKRFVVVFNDISQISRIKSLEEINEHKSSLLSSVSHELRTPLNSSIIMTELALQENNENVSPAIKETLLKPSQFSQKLLLNIINDILDYSRLSSQKLILNFHPTDIIKVIKDVEYIMSFQVKQKGLSFNVDTTQLQNIRNFCTDENRLTQILLNLLSNATKFTLTGFIKVTAISKTDENNNHVILIEVEDSGIGIDEADQQKLFKTFSKVDNTQT